MKYLHVEKAIFLNRPNRFIAQVLLQGQVVTCHVKNTGRCRELLQPKATVYCAYCPGPQRKTDYDLIAVEKKLSHGRRLLINMDSQAPNQAVQEWLRAGGLGVPLTYLKPECRYDQSRFDFYGETASEKFFLEVKGVTLEQNGVVLFPDAPTQRGLKHLHELIRCRSEGYQAYLILVVQMARADYFKPNDETQPAFGQTLLQAQAAGVKIRAYTCRVTPASLQLAKPLPVRLA